MPGLSQRTVWHEGAGLPPDTAVREAEVAGIPATGRGTSADVAAVVFAPVGIPADTVGLLLVTRTAEEGLPTERDADGGTAAEVDGRLTRVGSPSAASFPVFFAALSRASWLAFAMVIQVSDVVASQSKLLFTPAQPVNSRTLPASRKVYLFIEVFLVIQASKGVGNDGLTAAGFQRHHHIVFSVFHPSPQIVFLPDFQYPLAFRAGPYTGYRLLAFERNIVTTAFTLAETFPTPYEQLPGGLNMQPVQQVFLLL